MTHDYQLPYRCQVRWNDNYTSNHKTSIRNMTHVHFCVLYSFFTHKHPPSPLLKIAPYKQFKTMRGNGYCQIHNTCVCYYMDSVWEFIRNITKYFYLTLYIVRSSIPVSVITWIQCENSLQILLHIFIFCLYIYCRFDTSVPMKEGLKKSLWLLCQHCQSVNAISCMDNTRWEKEQIMCIGVHHV